MSLRSRNLCSTFMLVRPPRESRLFDSGPALQVLAWRRARDKRNGGAQRAELSVVIRDTDFCTLLGNVWVVPKRTAEATKREVAIQLRTHRSTAYDSIRATSYVDYQILEGSG